MRNAARFGVVALFLVHALTALASIQLPVPITAEATGPTGAAVSYHVSSSSAGTGDDENGRPTTTNAVTCSHASGSIFPLGTTSVNCSATDGSKGSFTVTVVDTTPPALQLPRAFTTQTTDPAGITVTYTASAADLVDGAVAVQCDPASGAFFPVGTTSVTCTATDAHSNGITGHFDVTVQKSSPPPPPPPPQLPADITAEATSAGGAIVTYTVSSAAGGDDFNGRPNSSLACAPASGSLFPLGATTVLCTSNTTPAGSFKVTVVDTTPPSLLLPASITADATSAAGAVVTWAAAAHDVVDGAVGVTCAPQSGSMFPIGTTPVQCQATDTHGNSASAGFTVTVTPFSSLVINVTATPNTLWPPDHKFVPVVVTVTAADARNVTAHIVAVSMSESDNGNTSPDWVITGALTLDLRAERNDATERVYTITVDAVDDSGNHAVGSVNVTVANPPNSSSAPAAPAPPRRRSARGGG
jgi:hypothetical protein